MHALTQSQVQLRRNYLKGLRECMHTHRENKKENVRSAHIFKNGYSVLYALQSKIDNIF